MRPLSPGRNALALALVTAVLAVFGRSFGHDFVRFDDDVYVLENERVRAGLSFEGVRWAFSSFYAGNWHPLTWLSHMLDCELFGLDAGPAHLVSGLVHAASAVLLFAFLARTTKSPWASFVAAGLFALHPLRAESVAWISERKDVLAVLFALFTMNAWARYAARPTPRLLLLVHASFAVGLMAKPSLVTLPFGLLLLDVWPLGRLALSRTPEAPGRRATLAGLVREKLGLFALAAAAASVTALAQTAGGATRSFEALPLAARLVNAPIACATYVARTFWPQRLSFFYPHPALLDPGADRVALAAGAALALALVTAACVAMVRRRPWLAVGWLWFLGMLVPTIGLVQVGEQALADRYTYLPSIGLVIAVVFGLREPVLRRPGLQAPLALLAGVALVAASVVCFRQVGIWRNSETLFAHALALEPRNWLAHNNLGLILAERGELDRAAAEYRAALAVRPDYGRASYNLGWVELQRKNLDAARALFLDSLRHGSPTAADAHLNLGVIAARQGDFAEAARAFERALAFDPERAAAESNLGTALARLGRPAEAIRRHRRALALDPELRFSQQGLAWLLATCRDDALRDGDEALRWARAYAERAGPREALALQTLAAATAEAGDLAGAAELQARALALAPPPERPAYEARLLTLRGGKPLRD